MSKKEGPLRIAIKDLFSTWVAPTFEGWVTKILEAVERSMRRVYSKAIDRTLSGMELPPEAREMIDQLLNPGEQGGAAGLLGFGTQMGMSAASSLLAPVMRYINYGMDRIVKSARVDPSTAIQMAWRMPEFAQQILDDMNDLGWPEHMQETWKEILKPRMSIPDLVTLKRRQLLSGSEFNEEMTRRGWSEDTINQLLEVTTIIPGVNDLIQMAVREAFTPATVEKFRYADDFPEDVVPFAEAQGLNREWVERYWYAHWQLPSTQAGYTMMHRLRPGTTENPFTIKDLETLLKTADIPPFFRERLKEISFATYTRVDVRRMYGAGVLNADEVYSAYLDQGYDEDKAQKLADFAIVDAGTDDRELTRSLITAAYERGTISRDEALKILQEIGYPAAKADFIITIEDADISKKKLNVELERVEFLYGAGELDEPGVYSELGPSNLPAEQIANLIGKWDLERRKKRALPGKSELEDWYKRDIIDLAELSLGLANRRYVETDIEKYLIQLDQRITEDATKEVERAQKEQDRLLASDIVDAYLKEKAGFDLEIAKSVLAIADLKLSLHDLDDAEQIAQAKEQMDRVRVYIAEVRVVKSQIKLELE